MEHLVKGWNAARRLAKEYGPYVVVEAVMPGGTLLALLLYAYRHRKEGT